MSDNALRDFGNSEVVTLVVTAKVKPESEAAFLEVARGMIEKVGQNEPGAVLYTLAKSTQEEHTYVWLERYKDEAAAQAHRETEYLAAARAAIAPLLAEPMQAMRLKQQLPE